MREFYRRFLKTGISLEPFGLLPAGKEDGGYFCTPVGAELIGRTGVDGIHYCFAPGYEETVFAVNPSGCPGENLHPVARNFEEFLGLLISCGDEAALEQSWMWSREQFEQFCAELEPSPERERAARELQDRLNILTEQDPFACLEEIREEVSCSRLRLPKEYYEALPEEEDPHPWEVRFAGREGRPGAELTLNRWITWADRRWYIPAVYSCGKGMVVDFCLQVPMEQITSYLNKWRLTPETEDGSHLTSAEQEQARSENPMCFEFRPALVLNGRDMSWTDGRGECWSGCLPGYEDRDFREGEDWMEHYSLDRGCCWSFFRYSFPWATSRKPKKFDLLFLGMKQERREQYAAPFNLSGPGEEITLTNPADGHTYRLKAEELRPETAEMDWGDGRDYPTRCWQLDYSLSPALPGEQFRLQDCADCDRPVARPKPEPSGCPYLPESRDDEVLALIGGEDGPTAVAFVTEDRRPDCRSACSSLRFELPETVTWQPVFLVKDYSDGAFQLI